MAKRKSVIKPVKRVVAYCPPPREVIDSYARDVCQQLGEKVDATYASHEMQRDLANFLKIIASMCAKSLTKQTCDDRSLDKEKQWE